VTRSVGGTLVSRILGISPWGGQLSAYYELREGVQAPRNAAMSRGNALEASVLALLAEREGGDVDREVGRVIANDLPHAHATLDACWRAPGASARSVVDAKTANAWEMGAWGSDGSDKVPEVYALQLLWYVGVCKAAGMDVTDTALVPVLSGPEAELQWAAKMVQATGRPLRLADLDGTSLDFRVCRVEWDEALFRAMNERVRRFLREHVDPGIPPMPGPADFVLDRDAHAVAKGTRGEGLVLDYERLQPSESAQVDTLLDCVRQRKGWEEAEGQARTRVQLLMGGAEEVRGLPGGDRVTWRASQTGVRRFTVKTRKGD
jgi:hypothetical protein